MNTYYEMTGWTDTKKDTKIKAYKNAQLLERQTMERSTSYDKKFGERYAKSIEARGAYEDAVKARIEAEKLLDEHNTFVNTNQADIGTTRVSPIFSLGDENGRVEIDANTVRIADPIYCNTNQGENTAENGDVTITSIGNGVNIINTDEADIKYIDSAKRVKDTTYSDDPKTIDAVIEDELNIELANKENAVAFEILKASQTPLTIKPVNICSQIAKYLCSKAKKNCTIYVSHVGFAYLDSLTYAEGTPLLTRRDNGEFYLENKYPVREIDGDTLGDTDIIIGDLSVVHFYLLGVADLEKHDIGRSEVAKRRIRKEIIVLSTDNLEAYISGSLDISEESIVGVNA